MATESAPRPLRSTLQARLPDELAERLHRQADRRFQTPSVLLRDAVREYVERLEREERNGDGE